MCERPRRAHRHAVIDRRGSGERPSGERGVQQCRTESRLTAVHSGKRSVRAIGRRFSVVEALPNRLPTDTIEVAFYHVRAVDAIFW